MTTPLSPREQGIADYASGKRFDECPWQGLKEEDIDRRWHWQKGWLHADWEKHELQKKAQETKP